MGGEGEMLTKAIFGRLWWDSQARGSMDASELIGSACAGLLSFDEFTKAWNDAARRREQPFDDWLSGRNVVAEIGHWWRLRRHGKA